jgi:selenocysteine-specific elongation factor
VRRIAPPDTLGGGRVLDPTPPRHGPGWRREAPTPAPGRKTPGPRATPGRPATSAAPSPIALRVLAALREDGPRPRGAAHLAADLGLERRQVEAAFGELATAGEAIRAKPDVVYETAAYRRLAEATVALAERDGAVGIGAARDAFGLSRKYAQALLEQLDAERRLRRDGERHLPRRGPR